MGEKQKRRYFFRVTPFIKIRKCLFFHYMLAKGGQCQCGQLEMLSAEWDADDGDAKHDTKGKVGQADPNATQENPEDVHDDVEASSCLRRGFYTLTKRTESQETEL